MTNFVIQPPEKPWLPDFMRARVPSLVTAGRYLRLDATARESASLVAASLAAHWLDLEARHRAQALSAAECDALLAIYDLAEELAGHPDPSVREIVADELLENLDIDLPTALAIRDRLGPRSRALFNEVLG